MTFKEITYKINDRIATITLNRPEKLNAWTRIMAEEVRTAMYGAANDETVRVIILTGQGKGFCAGADMGELDAAAQQVASAFDAAGTGEQKTTIITGVRTEEERGEPNRFAARSDFRKRYSYFPSIPKPIIAAVNGPTAGLGLIMTLYCDLRFASESARFTTAFSRRGLIAEHGISWILPAIVGLPNALDLLFSARDVSAHEALSMGLVNRIFPDEGLMEGVIAYAAELAALVSPRSLRVMKKQLYDARFQTLAEATVAADEELILAMKSEDCREGVAHFLEKRPPEFTGK